MKPHPPSSQFFRRGSLSSPPLMSLGRSFEPAFANLPPPSRPLTDFHREVLARSPWSTSSSKSGVTGPLSYNTIDTYPSEHNPATMASNLDFSPEGLLDLNFDQRDS